LFSIYKYVKYQKKVASWTEKVSILVLFVEVGDEPGLFTDRVCQIATLPMVARNDRGSCNFEKMAENYLGIIRQRK